jgi:preprotein translocase subunit SecG
MNRTTGKKIAFGFSIASLVGMAASLLTFTYFFREKGINDPLTASALATIIFFASCAIVLYFMSQPPRYELRPWDEGEKEEDAI